MKKNPSSSIRLYCVRPVREAGEEERKACRAAPEGIWARHAGSSPGGRGDSEPAATPEAGQRRPPRNSRRRPLPGERPGGPRRSSQRRLLPSERTARGGPKLTRGERLGRLSRRGRRLRRRERKREEREAEGPARRA